MSATRATLATSSKEISRLVARQGEQNGIVLAPIDFSGHSRAALVQAGRYAQMMDASLVALHVVHDPGEMPGYYSKLIKKKRATRIPDIAADAFDDFMADIVRENPHIPALQSARRLMVTGLPVTRILELVDFLEPAMVVSGDREVVEHDSSPRRELIQGAAGLHAVADDPGWHAGNPSCVSGSLPGEGWKEVGLPRLGGPRTDPEHLGAVATVGEGLALDPMPASVQVLVEGRRVRREHHIALHGAQDLRQGLMVVLG